MGNEGIHRAIGSRNIDLALDHRHLQKWSPTVVGFGVTAKRSVKEIQLAKRGLIPWFGWSDRSSNILFAPFFAGYFDLSIYASSEGSIMTTFFAIAVVALATGGQVVHPDQLTGDGAKAEPRSPRAAIEIGTPPDTVKTREGRVVQNGLRSKDYEYVLGDGVTTKEVVYYSQGVACYAKIFYPKNFNPNTKPGIPGVVMGQGYGGTHVSIEKYANRFAEKGLVAMTIDYRGWGFSEGFPELVKPVIGGGVERDDNRFETKTAEVRIKRTKLIPQEQQQDFRNAISYLQGEPGVDYQRIGLWGSSLAGGNATVVAGQDARVKAVSIQIPAITGPATIPGRHRLIGPAREDAIKRAREGQGAEYATGFSRYFATDQFDQMAAFQENYVGFWSTKIDVPYQVVHAAKDQLIPVDGVKAAIDRVPAKHKNLIVVPEIGHFEMYSNEPFEISANAAADWLVKYLNAPEAADAPEPKIPVRSAPANAQPSEGGRRTSNGASGN
jgi:dienelactone hydrolase